MSNYQVYLNLFSPFLQHWLTWFLEEMNVVYKRGVKKYVTFMFLYVDLKQLEIWM